MKTFRLRDAEDHISASAIGKGGKVVPSGTILLLVRGMTLHNDIPIGIAERDVAFNQDIKALQAAEGVDSLFLAYWLLAHKPDLLASVDSAGHGTGRLVTETLKGKRVMLPPLPEQKAAALFPAAFEESALGEIPKGWTVKPLSELCSYLSRGIGPAYLEAGGVLVLNQKCIRDHRVNPDLGRRHNDEKKSIKGRLVEQYDVLVNSTGVGTLGRVAQVLQLSEPTIVDSHVTIVRAAKDIDSHLLGVNLTGRESEIEGLGEGSTGQTELSRVRLGTLPVLTPPPEVQNAFGRFARPIFDRIAANENQCRTLAILRDTLLPKLLSGELPVGAATTTVEASV